MLVIATFFIAHWLSSIFFQTFFYHRYASHRMFTMSRGWQRFFHFCGFVALGSSYMMPRAYAVLHREHHAFSDTERDPHAPRRFGNAFTMMWQTKLRYSAIVNGSANVEPRFEGGAPTWAALDKFGDHYLTRVGWAAVYTLVYIVFAPHWALFLLLPIHFLMGPVHGAIVNWCGHKYGYRNFGTDDRSRNTVPFDILTMGELFQNNHHRFPMSPTFAARWFEVDPGYLGIRLLAWLRIVTPSAKVQTIRYAG